MLSNFAQRFITAKNICAAAMRKSPRLRWKNDARGPRGSGDEGIASGATRAIYAVDDEEARSKWGFVGKPWTPGGGAGVSRSGLFCGASDGESSDGDLRRG